MAAYSKRVVVARRTDPIACVTGLKSIAHRCSHSGRPWSLMRLGFDWEEELTLGRAAAGLNACSKGKALGLFEPTSEAVKEMREQLRTSTPTHTVTC
jgi:hypothetical protein